MKRIFLLFILILFITAGLPFFIVEYFRRQPDPSPSAGIREPMDEISVYVKAQDAVVSMATAQYLKEVVAAEMPAAFEPEALKAQAVAARTYLLNRVNVHRSGTEIPQHKGADICTDSTHCKAWICEADRRASWESDADTNWEKISAAVDDTTGIVITYNQEPISAVFHSTSSGYTENAKDVWGGNVPYLVSVASLGEEQSPRYQSEVNLSFDEFKAIGTQHIQNVDWNKALISDIVRSDAGGIISITVGGVPLKGSVFRTIFGLRSTNAQITMADDRVIMQVKGFGHGVGMSQYGANYLAGQGKNYVEILKTYYTGVDVGPWQST